MNRWISRLALMALLALPSVALASPGLIPVQGTLYDTAGEPVSGTLPVTYTLYADAAASVPLWSDTFSTLFTAGIFTAYLGADSPINLVVFDTYDDVWVGISIDGDPEIGVFRVATAPFAGHAEYCDSAAVLSPEGTSSVVTAALASADARYAPLSHRTPWSTIDGIPADIADGDRVLSEGEVDAFVANNGFITQSAADGRYAAASHTHPWSQITGIPGGFADGVDNTSSGVRVVPRNCLRFGYVNTYDGPVDFTCPDGRVMVGTDSVHDNGREDRIFRFTCCEMFVE